MTKTLPLAALTLAVAAPAAALAQQDVDLTADFSAEVLLDGVREFDGGVSTAFFNVQGDDDEFARFAVADFTAPDLGADVTDVSDFTLSLTQDNAGFSANGSLAFFLTDASTEINVDSPLNFVSSGDADDPNISVQVLGDQFGGGPLFAAGLGQFDVAGDEMTQAIDFNLSGPAQQFVIDTLNNGGTLRVIGTPGDGDVQATFSGAGSLLDPPMPPVLSFDATLVPEPAAAGLLGVAGLVALRRRRA